MAIKFTVSTTIPAAPKAVYDAWLSSKGHAAMTGSAAKVTAREGGKFSAWDGYITGRNLKLVPARRIVQAWRTTEFASGDEDSQIDVLLENAPGGTKLTLRHTNIPKGQSDYKSGWKECYFEPMKAYFAKRPGSA
ncbi:conserved hypothetical protein [Candidatus Sulfotelmatomonas gaucii]|uniref:Activator of Hsp90 ATPase homologue 1/2-like C-terminal domain-containing protein n=1 Tax=Candidatus Sulfuritelmatomonas gaucii TaxID=2043161 RepID=A0A2N9LL47_9BACT|nr:conserved hypothetical protein [Candidatus Sulfotelmatomonas gaucii]